MLRSLKINAALFSGLFFGALVLFHWLTQIQPTQQHAEPTIGNASTLVSAYDRWKTLKTSQGKEHSLSLPLTYVKGLSAEYSQATGRAKLDLVGGVIDIKVSGLSKNDSFDVWLVDKQSNNEQIIRKTKIHIGQLTQNESNAELQATLDANDLAGFELNHIVVTYAGQAPEKEGLLFGSPTLFQRLYYNERRLMAAAPSTNQSFSPNTGKQPDILEPFAFLLPAPAFAQGNSATVDIDALIAEGENLFFNETFAGNGRTCGTCHREENNFTIDPAFIASLPANDPLFVAEFNADLAELENPTLMRQFGLILANVDGLEDPANKFVMRSVPHMLGMSMSIQSSATEPPLQMTGWSGDGAPGAGTLRDFSTGAVVQHFTQTLDRIEGQDFRLPNDAELDAMEAFMLSLGRREDPDLNNLRLTNVAAERGRGLFLAEDSQNRTVQAAKCNICHRNAGALTLAGDNPNFITGVENMLHPADMTGEIRPRDEGFGTQLNETTGGFGDSSFNISPLWEAADTAPYFHHNGAATLEDAIAFYDSLEFKKSVEGQRLLLMDSGGQEMAVETDALAAFLRVINVLENVRSANDFMERATGQSRTSAKKILKLAKADINDALDVLAEGELHEEDVVPYFEDAKALVDSARDTGKASKRDGLISQAITAMQDGKALMVDSSPITDTTNPVVSIFTPVNLDTVAGITMITADATDDVAVERVTFMIGTMEIGLATAPPFDQSWDTSLFADGPTLVTVKATDTSGNNSSASITVTVENQVTPPPIDTTPPTVSITNPADVSNVSGTVTISADVMDDVAVGNVTFKVGQTEIGAVLTPPYEIAWDTTAFADGSQQISVIAVDTSNNSSEASVTVNVDNISDTCTVYSCPNPPPPSTEPPPDQTMPDGSSPDGEFESVLESKDTTASTITFSTEDGPLTLKITASTEFMGSIASNIDQLLVGHVIQGEFFSATNEIVWIEADLPPGL